MEKWFVIWKEEAGALVAAGWDDEERALSFAEDMKGKASYLYVSKATHVLGLVDLKQGGGGIFCDVCGKSYG